MYIPFFSARPVSQVRGHPNIVGLRGICESTSVQDFFSTRLDDLILKPRVEPLPISQVLSMSLDAARGLQALHEVPGGAIVHYDLKPAQLMVGEDGTVKINDFNMCQFTDADAEGKTCPFTSVASNPGMHVCVRILAQVCLCMCSCLCVCVFVPLCVRMRAFVCACSCLCVRV